MRANTQHELLTELSSTGRFGDSVRILGKVVTRYMQMLAWVEEELSRSGRSYSLWLVINQLSNAEKLFLFRTCEVRVLLDKIASHLLDGDETSAFQKYKSLEFIFRGLHSRYILGGELSDKWEALGFDMAACVTSPFPLVVSAWVGRMGQSEEQASWNESSSIDALFDEMILSAGAEPCVLRPMAEEQVWRVEQAIVELDKISSEITKDIALHVRHICLMDVARWRTMKDRDYRAIGQSMSRHLMPSCIFLSLNAFQSEFELIEAIYHESLHRKLGNILFAEEILRKDYSAEESQSFICPWNPDLEWNRNAWPFDRTLDAFHVYVHFYIYYGVLLENPEGKIEEDLMARRNKSYGRAKCLGQWLNEYAGHHMGGSGPELLLYLQLALERSRELDDHSN